MSYKLRPLKYTTLLVVFFSLYGALPSQGMEEELSEIKNEQETRIELKDTFIVVDENEDKKDLNEYLAQTKPVSFMDKMSVVPSALTGCGAVVSILAQSIKTYCRYTGTTVPFIVEPILLVGEVLWLSSAASGVWYNWKTHQLGKL